LVFGEKINRGRHSVTCMHSEGDVADDPAFLRKLVANTSEGILTIDTDSVIVFANPAVERILGYEPEELMGSSKMRIIPERLRSAHETGLAQYVETGEKHIDWSGFELPALHRDGHEVPVSVSLREHEYEGERLFTGIITDISERKERERRLREQKRELEQFADVLSHDLRNPLSVARAQLAIGRERGDEEFFDTVEESLERIDEIIEDMLARARHEGDGLDVESVSLRAVFRAAWEGVVTHDASLVLPDEEWRVAADRRRLRQLAENLVRNAVEHAGQGVTVRVGVLDDGFYVTDDGPGYPADVLNGARDDGRYGLSIVESVAKEHGWDASFSNDDGARVEFTGVRVARE